MKNYRCNRCGNTIMLGSYRGEVCPLDQGTLVLADSTGAKPRPIESHDDTATLPTKTQVLLNE